LEFLQNSRNPSEYPRIFEGSAGQNEILDGTLPTISLGFEESLEMDESFLLDPRLETMEYLAVSGLRTIRYIIL